MGKFIYAKGNEKRDYLLSQGFRLIKSDTVNEIYTFEMQDGMNFSLDNSSVASNTLTF